MDLDTVQWFVENILDLKKDFIQQAQQRAILENKIRDNEWDPPAEVKLVLDEKEQVVYQKALTILENGFDELLSRQQAEQQSVIITLPELLRKAADAIDRNSSIDDELLDIADENVDEPDDEFDEKT